MTMRKWVIALVCCLLVGMLVGCAPRADVFDTFSGSYTAELTGELYGISFSARLEREAAEGTGASAATVTFYAPDLLSGTTVTRSATGEITVVSGGLSLPDAGGIGAALFSLFPTSGEITDTALTEEGYTRVTGEGFVLTLLSDGTPLDIETDAVRATVVKWEKRS